MPIQLPPDHFTTFRASIDKVEEGTISGIAVKYGLPVERGDNLFEQVNAGAFKAQLDAPNRIPVLFQHDSHSPIGRATDFIDSSGDLRFTAKLSTSGDIPEAAKTLALLREGIIDEVSIGFEWGSWTEKREDGKMTIMHTKARLREFSIVTFGAQGQSAKVKSVASDGINPALIRLKLASLTA